MIIWFAIMLAFYMIVAAFTIWEMTLYSCYTWLFGITVGELAVNILALVFDIQLIVLHRWLQAHEVRTFDLVLFERAKA